MHLSANWGPGMANAFGTHGRRLLYSALGQTARVALQSPCQQPGHIEHVLRLKFPSGPLAIRFKLQTHEVAGVAVHAITHTPLELDFGMVNPHRRVARDRSVKLDTGSGG